MDTQQAKTHLVTVSSPDGERSFTVSGLSAEELRNLMAKASDGRFFKVIELDTVQQQTQALGHLSDATMGLAVVFIATALLVRRLQRWLQH